MTAISDSIDVLIGLDDTDNLESCGTGFHARTIASELKARGLASPAHITRHQLLMSPLVPYTSHNSAACVRVSAEAGNIPSILDYCRDYLVANSAEGSDAGLCVAAENVITSEIQRFGFLCKRRRVYQQDARRVAEAYGLPLLGLTGTHDGIIGALSAVGLHASGSDGRLLWLKGVREMTDQVVDLGELFASTGLDIVQSVEGEVLTDSALKIAMSSWPRAVWMNGEAVLIVEKGEEHDGADWRVASKQYLKQF
ncbi:MAG TPA: hypothetical protein VK959_01125 [Methylophilaceae bacterium]|jgi:hypothetical protein|nr:hypothetical protein [Methylophilaceae bacterium]